MANPNPNPPPKNGRWKAGQSGNPKGRPKGIKNWSTLVQELLDDAALADKLLAKKPSWWDKLPGKNAGHAIVVAMMIEAMNGDTKAATWLRRTGYGDKIDFGSGDGGVQPVAIVDMRSGQRMTLVPLSMVQPPAKRKPAKKAVKKPAPAKKKPVASKPKQKGK
jgi:hypothetical protein